MKIGIFLGSFDPFHQGHYKMVRSAFQCNAVDKVIIVPAKHNPWKEETHASLDDRIAICKSYFENELFSQTGWIVEVSDIERNRTEPVYSSDTLRDLKKMYPNDDLRIIVGPDTYKDINNWHEGRWILEHFSIITVDSRFGNDTTNNMSSTHIRDLLVRNEPISSNELGLKAYDYIKQHALYGIHPL